MPGISTRRKSLRSQMSLVCQSVRTCLPLPLRPKPARSVFQALSSKAISNQLSPGFAKVYSQICPLPREASGRAYGLFNFLVPSGALSLRAGFFFASSSSNCSSIGPILARTCWICFCCSARFLSISAFAFAPVMGTWLVLPLPCGEMSLKKDNSE